MGNTRVKPSVVFVLAHLAIARATKDAKQAHARAFLFIAFFLQQRECCVTELMSKGGAWSQRDKRAEVARNGPP